MPFCSAASNAILAECEVLNLKPPSKVGTGVCFLDHMIDQLTSHGQLGVTLRCGIVGAAEPPTEGSGKRDAPEAPTKFFAPLKDYAIALTGRPHDRDIFIACGGALGAALRRVVEEAVAAATGSDAPSGAALFCCPLDEAFAEATLDLCPSVAAKRGQCVTELTPYGNFAGSDAGRQWVGRYRTELTPLFWSALADGLGATLTLRRVRGANAHHILESTFKSFARAFRAALDRIADGRNYGCALPAAPPPPPPELPANLASPARRAERRRATKETTIEVRVDLDAPYEAADEPAGGPAAWTGKVMTATKLRASVEQTERIATGIPALDRVLTAIASAGGFSLIVHCEGDRHIDDHHTAEDVAITLGQCLHEALGDKAGLARMGCAEGEHAGARVRAVLDLSNRPHFESDLLLNEEYVGGGGEGASPSDAECGGVLSCEMLHHVFDSLTIETRATCHLEMRQDTPEAGHTLGLALAAASAFGAALARAMRVDPRRRGAVASSKGTLSK